MTPRTRTSTASLIKTTFEENRTNGQTCTVLNTHTERTRTDFVTEDGRIADGRATDATPRRDGTESESIMEAPRTVDEVFANFSARRAGLVHALTGGTHR